MCLGNGVCSGGDACVCVAGVTCMYVREGSVGNLFVWVYKLKMITIINI